MASFDISIYKDDIAILFLDQIIPDAASTVKTIDLETGNVEPDTICEITSFGRANPNQETAPVLMNINVSVIADDLCRETYKNNFQEGKMCTGRPDSLKEESGGSLVCNGKLVGVNLAGSSGLYAKVGYYVPWIQTNLQENQNISHPIDFSSQVSLRNRYKETQNTFGQGHVCSGVLIGDKHVLTAASCVYRYVFCI